MCCGRLIVLQHDKGLANVVICDPSREFLNAIMYCDFKLMVRLSLFFLETCPARVLCRMYYTGGFCS